MENKDTHMSVILQLQDSETLKRLEVIDVFPLDSEVDTRYLLNETITERMIEANSQFIANYSSFVDKINDSFKVISQIRDNCASMHEHIKTCRADSKEMLIKSERLETKIGNLKNELNDVNFAISEFMLTGHEDSILSHPRLDYEFVEVLKRLGDIVSRIPELADSELKNDLLESNSAKLMTGCLSLQKCIEDNVRSNGDCISYGLSILRDNEWDLTDMWGTIVNIRREALLMDMIDECTNNIGSDPDFVVGGIVDWMEERVRTEIGLFSMCEGGNLKDKLNRVTADVVQPFKDEIEQYIFSLSDYSQLQRIYSILVTSLSRLCHIEMGSGDKPVRIIVTIEDLSESAKNILYNSLIHHSNMLMSTPIQNQLVPPSQISDIVQSFAHVVDSASDHGDSVFAGKLIDSLLRVCSLTSCRLDHVSSAVYNVNFHSLLLPISRNNMEKREMLENLIISGIENMASLQARLVLGESRMIGLHTNVSSNEDIIRSANMVESIVKNYSNFSYPEFGQIVDSNIRRRFMVLSLQTVLRVYDDVYTMAAEAGIIKEVSPTSKLKQMSGYFI